MDGLTTACRDNPLAAALIGGGALWLLIGSDRLKNAAGTVTSAAAPLADLGARAQRSAASTWDDAYGSARDRASRMQEQASRGINETSRSINETMRNTRTAASDAMSGAAETMSERFDEGVAGAREMFDWLGRALPRKETFAQAQSSLSDLLERQPLVLGAVGLAIGAAVAGAIARTDIEDEWVGNVSDELKEDLKERVGAVSQSVREGADTLKGEITDAGAEYADRVKQAGQDAIEAARGNAGSEKAPARSGGEGPVL
jgi:F0F1-type ATP synthase membrane subunit b/b'